MKCIIILFVFYYFTSKNTKYQNKNKSHLEGFPKLQLFMLNLYKYETCMLRTETLDMTICEAIFFKTAVITNKNHINI